MKLYGTTTSPFVRRVRIVAAEVGEPVDLVQTANEVGQAALREVSPIRKVPVAIIDGKTLFDSRVIIEYLTLTRGWGTLAPPRDRWRELNLVNAIDGALDAVIQLFYLKRDNLTADNNHAYGWRQIERADSIFTWLAAQLADDRTFESGFGLAEISAICALDWMQFREQYATADRLAGMRAAWAERPSVASTKPHT